MPELQPHQQRVVDEREALAGNVDRLSAFLDTKADALVDAAEKDRLTRQLDAMRVYLGCLDERIAAFGG